MALVEIARFLDPQEAHIAAGALKSEGFTAIVNDTGYGSVDPLMRQATGGFPLWVEDTRAVEAKALIEKLRAPDRAEALAWTAHPKVFTALPWAPAALLWPEVSLMLAGAKSRPTILRLFVLAIITTVIVAMVAMAGVQSWTMLVPVFTAP